MNFKQYVLKEAKIPIRDTIGYFKSVKRLGNEFGKNVNALRNFIEKEPDFLEDWFSNSYIDDIIKRMHEWVFDDTKHNTLNDIVKDLDILINPEQYKGQHEVMYKYMPQRLESAISKYSVPFHGEHMFDDVEEMFSRKEEHYQEYPEVIQFMGYVRNLIKEYKNILYRLTDMKEKIETQKNWSSGAYYNGPKWKPEDFEEVEVAYHASIHARNIMKEGFKSETPISGGIGGGNIKNGISFTLDLYEAKGIAKVFKIGWMIAHGKFGLRHMEEMLDNMEYIGKEDGEKYDKNTIIHQYKMASHDNVYPPKEPHQMMKLYTTALWFLKTYNPVFFGVDMKEFVGQLKLVEYKDIGVVKCKVKTANAEFLVSMAELRVTPEDVVSIDELIQ